MQMQPVPRRSQRPPRPPRDPFLGLLLLLGVLVALMLCDIGMIATPDHLAALVSEGLPSP
jgi:hypothetical protein